MVLVANAWTVLSSISTRVPVDKYILLPVKSQPLYLLIVMSLLVFAQLLLHVLDAISLKIIVHAQFHGVVYLIRLHYAVIANPRLL